jgi:hypothetical protein
MSYYASEPPINPYDECDEETCYQRQEPPDEGEWCDEGSIYAE